MIKFDKEVSAYCSQSE